jgi:Glyoxalase-like domain
MTIQSQVDHLVVAATSLDEGVAWCESTFGITPGPGGEHPLMGTHNRLFSIASETFPDVYFEIIAIQPGAATARPPGYQRWFDLDDAALQAQLASNGPQLIHFVARNKAVDDALHALQALNIDRGELLAASRPTPNGLLTWQITVRPDGQRLFAGALPTLIEWGAVHPARSMPPSGVVLKSLAATHPQADALQAGFDAIGLGNVAVQNGPANLAAVLQTPRGLITLESKGI